MIQLDLRRIIVHNLPMKSNFWSYKTYLSKRQRYQNGAAESGWNGPFFFENPVNNLEVKKWIREHLGIKDTSHIEVKISLSEKKNDIAIKSFQKSLNRELKSEIAGKSKSGARPGNLIVEWLKPTITPNLVA